VVRDIALSPEALTERFAQADLTRDTDLAVVVANLRGRVSRPAPTGHEDRVW
jgi:hypothetical protein